MLYHQKAYGYTPQTRAEQQPKYLCGQEYMYRAAMCFT